MTCFIFYEGAFDTKTELPNTLWVVSLDENNDVVAPLKKQKLEAIQAVVSESNKTVLVLPSTFATVKTLDLPKLSAKKALEAIPFALEDELADSVEDLQFAYQKQLGQSGSYEVTVVNKHAFKHLLSLFQEAGIELDGVALDYAALIPNEILVTDAYLLVHDVHAAPMLQGALKPALAETYLSKPNACEKYEMRDPKLWVAKRLNQKIYCELLPKGMQKAKSGARVSYKRYAALAVGCFLTAMLVSAAQSFYIHKQIQKVDADIATVYKHFFPDATQVISPRFRIERLMASGEQPTKRSFWSILNKVSKAYQKQAVEFTAIEFHDDKLWLHLETKQFAELESFKQALESFSVSVKQQEAHAHHHQVVAVLELEL